MDGNRAAVCNVADMPRTATILYIEDNLSNLELIRHILSQRPQVSLFSAVRGELGVELALRQRPDLILLDLHLPDIPGDEVLRRLRDTPETRNTPVIMISADATAGQADRMLKAGARAYLTKPFDVKQFLGLIDELLKELGAGAGG
jgi:CheY-like chemotaxis protein